MLKSIPLDVLEDLGVPIHPSAIPPAAKCQRCRCAPKLIFDSRQPTMEYFVDCGQGCYLRRARGIDRRAAVRRWNKRQGVVIKLISPVTGKVYTPKTDSGRKPPRRPRFENPLGFRSRWRAERYKESLEE